MTSHWLPRLEGGSGRGRGHGQAAVAGWAEEATREAAGLMNAMAAIAMAMPTLAAHPHPSWHCQVWQWPSSTSTSAAGRLRTPVLVSAQCHPRSRFSPFARPLITPAPHLHCHAVLPAPAPARQLLARAALDDSTMATHWRDGGFCREWPLGLGRRQFEAARFDPLAARRCSSQSRSRRCATDFRGFGRPQQPQRRPQR
jgi:hypothetical protein